MSMSVPELQDYEQQTTSFDAFGWFRTGRFHLTAPGEPQFVPGAAVTPALARQLGPPLLGQWFVDDTSAVISSVPVAAPRRRARDHRQRHHARRAPLHDQRRHAAGVPAADREPGHEHAATPRCGFRSIRRRPTRAGAAGRTSRTPAANPGCRWNRRRRTPGASPPIVAAMDPARYQFYTAGVADLRESTIGWPVDRPRHAADPARRRRAPAAHCLRQRRHAAAGAIRRPRPRDGDPRRARRVATAARAALLRRGRARLGRRRRRRRRSERDLRPAHPGRRVRIHPACRRRSRIDWKVLGFSVAVAVATGVLAGLAPLWQAMRTAPNAVLSEGVRASAAAPARRLSKAFVVAEIALAFTLLTTSAILVVHMRNLERVSLGFDPDGLVAFNLTLPRGAGTSEERAEQRRAAQARLMDALRQTPGVTGAAFASQLPAGPFCGGTPIYVEGRPPDALGQRVCLVGATPDFFSTMRIPLRAGRLLNESDSQQRDAPAVVINEAAARAYWPGRNPIGASARLSTPDNDRFEVVGVVGDVRNNGLNRPAAPEIYRRRRPCSG